MEEAKNKGTKRMREEGNLKIQKIDGKYFQFPLESLEPSRKRRKKDENEKKEICSSGMEGLVDNLVDRRQRYSNEKKISSKKKASLFNENLNFYRKMLIASMKKMEKQGTKTETFSSVMQVEHKNGEVENFTLKWKIYDKGKSATFSFSNEKNQLFDRNEISITTDKVFRMVIKCGISKNQYKFIAELFEGHPFPPWSVMEANFSKNRLEIIRIMSVVTKGGGNDVIGFYLDIPCLLFELLKNKDILLDYVVRSVLGKSFFFDQEKKMNEYWKGKEHDRIEKMNVIEKEYKGLIFKTKDEAIKKKNQKEELKKSFNSKVNYYKTIRTVKNEGKKTPTLKLARLNIEILTTALTSGRSVSRTAISHLENLIKKFKTKIKDRHSHIPEEELLDDIKYKKDKLLLDEIQRGYEKINFLVEENRQSGMKFRNKLSNSKPSGYLGCKKASETTVKKSESEFESNHEESESESQTSFEYVCSMIFKVGGDGHVIFKNAFGKEHRDEEILFCLNNPFSSNSTDMSEYLLFLVVQMNENHDELISNLFQLNEVFEKLEGSILREKYSLNLSQHLYGTTSTLQEFLETFKVIPKGITSQVFDFRIKLKFVLGGDWKFLLQCLLNPKIMYSPFNFQISWYRKTDDLFSRSQLFSPQEIHDFLPKIFRYILRDNGNNDLFSPITSWFRWADLDLHMPIRIFTGLLKVEELVMTSGRLKTKLGFLIKMFNFGVSKSSSEFYPKDIGVKNYFFPKNRGHLSKRESTKSSIKQEKKSESTSKNMKKNLSRLEKFEDLIDSFIIVFKKMRKETTKNEKRRFGHSMKDFQNDFLSFEEVQDVIVDIERIWNTLPDFENEFTERSPYYLNYFFRGLVVHLSTWFLFTQTSQQTQELINLMMNNLHRKGSRYGGKPPQKTFYPILGKENERAENNRTLETMISVVGKHRIAQVMNIKDDFDENDFQ